MPKKKSVRIPSLQHFSVLLGGTTERIEKKIRSLSNLPPVSYVQLRDQWLIDLIRLGVPIEHIMRACSMLKGDLNRSSNKDALAALHKYLVKHQPSQLYPVDKIYFPIGRGLQVPVNPPGVIVENGVPKLFWPSFWKHGKFNGLTSAIFGSILERSFFRLSDYKDMPLAFLDLSIDEEADTSARSARVFDRAYFLNLSDSELREETDKFVTAYLRVLADGEADKDDEEDVSLPLFLDQPSP